MFILFQPWPRLLKVLECVRCLLPRLKNLPKIYDVRACSPALQFGQKDDVYSPTQ